MRRCRNGMRWFAPISNSIAAKWARCPPELGRMDEFDPPGVDHLSMAKKFTQHMTGRFSSFCKYFLFASHLILA